MKVIYQTLSSEYAILSTGNSTSRLQYRNSDCYAMLSSNERFAAIACLASGAV